jgi:hypothetical protein
MKYLKRYKIYENKSYFEDDINVEITSTVIDILQDFIDEGLNIQCFTVGYYTLKQAGVTHTDNDIVLAIIANADDNLEDSYYTLDFKRMLPYLERIIDYMKSEDRKADVLLQWRENVPKKHLRVRKGFGDLKQTECWGEDLSTMPDNNYQSISMNFKL